MANAFSERLRRMADVLDRLEIAPGCIYSVDMFCGIGRVHVEANAFFKKFHGPYERETYDVDERVSQTVDGVTFFCLAKSQALQVA